MNGERRVEIKLGDLCNNRCPFCVSGDQRDAKAPWTPLARVKGELAAFRARGCGAVGFLGGEPTAYPWIEEAVACARSLGYARVSLCTNGTRLSDAAFCARLVAAGLTRVTVSLHSHRPEIEDGVMTRVPGNHARKVAGLGHMLAWRARGALRDGVSLNPVLNRQNLEEMNEYLLFAKGLGVADVRFNFIWPDDLLRGWRAWVPSYREAAPRIVRAIAFNERRVGLRLSFGGVPRCVLRWAGISPRLAETLADRHLDEATLDPDNDVSIPSADGGRGDRFVWQERKKSELKRRGPRCGECRRAQDCEGVWGTYAEIYGLDELAPV
ncbi:MAG: radical SAM protein [Elusimicrobia bacterium]|nr:radical SAM protein [Elusimicrobiota bacterium]